MVPTVPLPYLRYLHPRYLQPTYHTYLPTYQRNLVFRTYQQLLSRAPLQLG